MIGAGERLNAGNTADGYFVVCNEDTKQPPNKPPCDRRDTGADLQNGPDTVVSNNLGRMADAVGYGAVSTRGDTDTLP